MRRDEKRVRRGAPGGFTLAEVMVAVAVFAVIAAIAMTLYQQLQKNFKQGSNATSEQQNTRIAFDRMIADLRMAGFNYNPDGATRPDEQIEGMWSNIVTVRGDYDYETPDANTPEPTLGGPTNPFAVVSTGNDEIVTYALGKPSGAGGTSVQFQADVTAVPRDGTVDTVTVNNVFLDMNSPPYTLYRMTLKPGGTALSSIVDRVPIADNIKRVDFTYFDAAGNTLATMAQGMDDPNSVAARKKIAKINVKIVGMTQDPDLAYFDPADTNPKSLHFRKFELTSDVTPRNLGFVGMPDLDLDKPTTPTGLSVCAGHCKGLYAIWSPNPSSQGVIKYQVTYGATAASQANPQDSYTTDQYIPNLNPSAAYVVGVAAVDAVGNMSDPAAFSPSTTTTNQRVPNPPTGLAATSIANLNAVANQVQISWVKPTTNTANVTCDVSPFPIRDLAGFSLFRGATVGFDPNNPAQVQMSRGPSTITAAMSSYSDPIDPNIPSVVNCRTYFYKMRSEDFCGAFDPNVATGSGSASTAVKPAKPVNGTALDMGNKSNFLTWNPVTQDVTPKNILIDKYKVYRTSIASTADPNLATYSVVYDGTVGSISSPTHTDANVPNIPGTNRFWYRISAHDDCVNESALSDPILVSKCNIGGSISVNVNPGGSSVSGVQRITVTVSAGITPVSGQLMITDTSNGTVVFNQTSTAYPYTFTWNSGASPTVAGNSYDITALVTNNSGCTDSRTTTVAVSAVIPCCITAVNPKVTANTSLGSVKGGVTNNEVDFAIANTCAGNVTITKIAMEWDNATQNTPLLTGWLYQGTPSIGIVPAVNPILSALSPLAVFDLTLPPFTTYSLPTTNGTSNALQVGYVFTKALVGKIKGNPVGDLVQTEYFFTVNGLTGTSTCKVSVLADPNTPGITLCDPTVDPNCPGF